MLGIGDELREKRESMGLSIYDIERETKIKSTFIEAIENENFEKLPGRVYVKGFVKNYAKFLGLDYMRYLMELNRYFEENQKEDILVNSKPGLVKEINERPLSSKIAKAAVFTLIFLLLAWGIQKGFVYFTSESEEKPGTQQEEVQPSPQEQESPDTSGEIPGEGEAVPGQEGTEIPAAKPDAQTPVSGDLVLEVSMAEDGPGVNACWIQVIVDGKLEFEETIFAGREPLKFAGEKTIDFTYGNAAAIRIKVNGVDQGVLGGVGEVGTKRFKVED